MSKESYIRGFFKAAEAKGVDPKALAKFAQQKVTGGRAPEGAPAAGSGKIPYLSTEGWVGNAGFPRALWSQAHQDITPQIAALRNIPWFKNWHDAHTNVISKLTSGMKKPSVADNFGRGALKALAEAYDAGMLGETNITDKAIAPAEKK